MKKKKLLAATMMAAGLLASSAAYATDVNVNVNDWAGLENGLTNGKNLTATGNITGANSVVNGKTSTLNLGGHTMSGATSEPVPTSGLSFSGGQNLTLTGGGTISNFYRPDTTPSSVTGNEFGIIDVRGNSTLTITGENDDWTFSGNKSGVGSINALNSTISANVDEIVFNSNISNAQGAGLRHQISDNAYITKSASIVANEIVFNNNKIETIGNLGPAEVGGGGAVMNSGGTMELLGGTNTFTNNKMNATIADHRKYKVGGGAVINQSHQMAHDGPAINSTMVIGADGNSTNTFTGNSSSTSGGAVMNRAVDTDGNATLTINGNTTFSGNTATENGGAIYNVAQNGHNATVTLNGTSTFTGNSAQYGGAIANIGARIQGVTKSTSDGNATLNLSDATFTGNSATSDGGAIYNAGTIEIDGGIFTGNTAAKNGGAIYNAGTLTISDTVIGGSEGNGNSSTGSNNYGGGIYTTGSNTVTINGDSEISYNTAVKGGGGIYVNGGTTNIDSSTISHNSATGSKSTGGGIYVNGGTVNITDTDITYNTAGAKGGAIYNDSGNVTISNAVFNSNTTTTSSSSGGAVYNNGGTVAITNSEFLNNSAKVGGAITNQKGTISLTDTSFTGNTATHGGGAIYNFATGGSPILNINAVGTDVLFDNNLNAYGSENEYANDIENTGNSATKKATLNLNAAAGKSITLNGGIESDGETDAAFNIVNITGAGTVNVSTIKDQTVSVDSGELHLTTTATDGSNLSGSTVTVASGATINTIDSIINDYATGGEGKGTITLADGAIIKGDIDYVAGTADTYKAANGASVIYKMANALGADVQYGDTKEIQVIKLTGEETATVNRDVNFAWYNGDHGLTLISSGLADGKVKVTGKTEGGIDGAAGETSDGTQTVIDYELSASDTYESGHAILNSDFTINGTGTAAGDPTLTLSADMQVGDATKTSTLTLNDVKLAEGSTTQGKIINSAGSTLNINDSLIGVAIQNAGTLISDPTYYEAKVVNEGTASFDGDTFRDITSGSALKNTGTGTTTLTNTDFTNNHIAASGAAIYNDSTAATPQVSITGGTFTKNVADSMGGAIYNEGTMSITGATFGDDDATKGNSSVYAGGAILNYGDISFANNNFINNKTTAVSDTLGGAIFSYGGDLTFNGDTFKSNSSAAGGAIWNMGGTIDATNLTIQSNTATSAGGGILTSGATSVELTNGTIGGATAELGNSAAEGGGIWNNGNLTITGTTIQNNTATVGGGIFSRAGIVNIKGATISNNTATSYYGGAIYNSGTLTIQENGTTATTFTDNSAAQFGGAINNAGSATIKGAIFGTTGHGNSAMDGGAINNIGTLTVQKDDSDNKTTFTANHATNFGGAIYHQDGTTTVKDAVFTSNTAGNGGAIASYVNADGLTINGSTFTTNSAEEGGAVAVYGDADIIGSTFESNSATETEANSGGGAVFVGGESNTNIIGSTFTTNTSAGNGGAIATRTKASSGGDTPSSSLYITGDGTAATEFNGNTAGTDGGAIWTEVKTVIANTNFTDNIAAGVGGAIAHTNIPTSTTDANNRLLEIIADGQNVTFSGNKTGTVGNYVNNDIYNTGRLDLVATGTNSITLSGGITGDTANKVYGDLNINKIESGVNDSYKVLNGTGDVVSQAISAANATGTVIFGGNVTTGSLELNAGKLTNNAELTVAGNLTGGNTISTVYSNATLDGTTGRLIIGDGEHQVLFSNNGKIANNITINKGSTLLTDPDATSLVVTDGNLLNDGTLSLTAGTIAFNVNDATTAKTGHTDIVGDTVNFATATTPYAINQRINILMDENPDSDSMLVANGANIGGDVYIDQGKEVSGTQYNSILRLTGGTMSNNIKGYTSPTTSLTTYGDVEITGDTTFASGKTADVGNLHISAGTTLTNEGTFTVRDDMKLFVDTTTDPDTLAQISNTGTLNLLGGEAADTMENAGTISGTGNVNIGSYTSEEVKDTAYVENTGAGSITGNITIAQGSTLKSDSSKTGTNEIKNDGTLIFNNASDGTIAQNITKSTAGTGTGIVEIAATDGKIISLATDKAITNNSIKLTSGILDATAKADTDGNIAATTFGSGLIANGGTLSVQDGLTGNINLGTVNTQTGTNAKDLNVKIDTNFATDTSTWTDHGIEGHADIISATVNGDKGIHISDIKMTADPIATEMKAQIATGSAMNKIDVTNTTISNLSEGAGKLMLSYDSTNGYLTGTHTNLNNAIKSTISSKMYSMDENEAIDNTLGALTLGGTSLSVTGNNKSIQSTDNTKDGIKIAENTQTLSITGATVGDSSETPTKGFATAIDNTAGGTVNLTNVTMAGNTTDVINDGEIDTTTTPATDHGVFLEGTNNIGTIKDSAGDASKGQTTIKSGESTIGSLIQKAVNVLSGGKLNIAADKLVTTDGTDNAGTLNLSGSTGTDPAVALASEIKGTGTTNVKGNVESSKDIEQETVYVGLSNGSAANANLTLKDDAEITADSIRISTKGTVNAVADKLHATNGINNQGTLNLSGDGTTPTTIDYAINGSKGTTNIVSGKVTTNENITQKAINVETGTELTTSATIDADMTTVDGKLVNDGGTIASADGTNNKVVVNKNGTFENAGAVGADIDNSGTLNNTGSITSKSNVVNKAGGVINNTNNGKINHLTNNAADSSTTPETPAGIVNTTADGIVASAINNGVLNLSGATTPGDTTTTTATITGNDGTTNIKTGNVTFGKNVTQQAINVETGTELVNDARISAVTTTVNGSLVNNSGATIASADGTNNKVIINGSLDNAGAIGADIDNSGTLNNTGSITSKSSITNVGDNASITNKGTIAGNITNKEGKDGIQIANAGTISGDVNNGDGAGNVINNSITEGGTTTQGEIQGNVVNAAGTVNSQADKIATGTGKKVTNDGTVNLTGADDATADNPTALSAAIESITDGKGTTNIAGNVTSNDKNITQGTVNVGSSGLDAQGEPIAANGSFTNEDGSTLIADAINVTAGDGTTPATFTNQGNIGDNTTAATINNSGVTNLESGNVIADAINNNAGSTTISGGSVTIADDTNNGIFNNGNDENSNIEISGGTVDTPAIVNNGSGTNTISGGNVNSDQITNNNGDTNITGGNVTADTITNTEFAGDGDNISITGGNIVANTIENAGTGTVDINQTDASGASTGSLVADAITNSGDGTTNISSAVKANTIASSDGTVNINANGKDATSDLLQANTQDTVIDTTGGGTVAVNTNSDKMTIDNNVKGNGTLALNGNSGEVGKSSNTGTQFKVDSNMTDTNVNVNSGELLATDSLSGAGTITIGEDPVTRAITDDVATFNSMDNKTTTYDNVAFNDNSNLKADVNAMSGRADDFRANDTGNEVMLTDLTIQDMEKIAQDSKTINLTDKIGLENLQSTDDLVANLEAKYTSVLTPIRKMNARVQVTDDGLLLNFVGTGNTYNDFNPAIFASPVATQLGGYLVQLNSYDQAFNNMDMYMLMTRKQRQALKMRNKIAATEGTKVAYDPTMAQTDYAGGWFRPYASFEKVGLAGGPKVENNSWGTFLGGESSMKDLGNGWDGMWGAYIGYNGAHQSYGNVGIYENGGTLGLVGMAYKDNFFVGATINGGMMAGEATTMYGYENFNMVMAGIAAKTGYNWELADGKFIIQPSIQTSYSFVNTFDYHNAAGVYLDSDALHAITIEPGIKFIGNLKGGWQPYAGLSGVFSIMDRTHFMANDVSLPMLSVSPYAKYGIGLRKTWGERFSGFFQMFVMSGGRNGFGMQGGFKWAIGADGTGHISKDAKNPELGKTKINLNNKKVSK